MEFLTSITAAEALGIITSFPLLPFDTEDIDLEQALGRVLAGDIVALEDIPPFSRSLVDGYAVRAKDTYGARENSPAFVMAKGEVRVGEAASQTVGEGESIYVSTGAMVPEGADSVVMQEYTRRVPDAVEITKTARRGENICFKGEDLRTGRVVLETGKTLSPFDLGVLAALGVTHFTVYRRPLIGLVSSGDEIVPADAVPPAGKVRDINTYTVSNLLRNQGCVVRFAGIAKDTPEDITEKLLSLKDSDMILLSGGSSKGQSDFMTTVIERLGGKILFHGLNIKPGKPTIFASLWDKPVFGLPGHPVSCSMVVLRFVFPLARRIKRQSDPSSSLSMMTGTLRTNVPSTYGIEEYVRVTVERHEDALSVSPIFAKSSIISTLSRADGYIIVPEGKEGLEAGEKVEVYPLG
ncbi:MAG: Molybdopterin molybdenumtransferase [Syntrophorhabdaceae bacterium PtaU1.Bin034]|nr:MAG: Molybdopterin molybdenumtransferase [Syntrophorhabdaceae bacterium PtaU1.Bin034]